VESALRIVDDRSINTIPNDQADQRRLAKRLGYQDAGRSRAEDAMLADIQAYTSRVRTLYEQLMQSLHDHFPHRKVPPG
jgi:glutamine synthetase adenylyltransferase